MERVLGLLLIIGIPIYFLFVWWKNLLTLRRLIFLVALEIGLASTYLPRKKGEWIGTAAGIVILSMSLVPAVLRWRRRAASHTDYPHSLQ
jgi:hypothetical protein